MSTTEEILHNHPLRTAAGWVQVGPFFVQDCAICRWIETDRLVEELVDILRCVLDEPDACRAVGRDRIARMTAIVEEHV